MVTANRKSTIDTHTKKKKESKYNTEVSNQITREENKRGREGKNLQKKSKTVNKMTIRTYISIIIVNVNGLKPPIKRRRLAE